MADELIAAAEKAGYPVRDYEGRQGSSWILVDLNGAVVHLFTEQARKEYQLETLWGDQPMPGSRNACAVRSRRSAGNPTRICSS